MTNATRLIAGAALSAALFASAAPVSAETLFKIVTVKDEIVVGLNDAELKELGGDAGGIAKAIAAKGSLSLWQYAVTQKNGERMVVPRAKIGVLAASSLRVEPYKQPFKVMAHD
jgi:chromosome segregation and condensation protein ScpB